MPSVNIHQAKIQLSNRVNQAAKENDIIMAHNWKLIARLLLLASLPFAAAAHAQFPPNVHFLPNVHSFESDDLRNGKVHVKRVALVPTTATVLKIDPGTGHNRNNPEELVAESRQLHADLLPIVTSVLRNVGFTLDDTTYSGDAVANKPEMADDILALQALFETVDWYGVAEQKGHPNPFSPLALAPKIKDVIQNKLHPSDDVDALAVVRTNYVIVTDSKTLIKSQLQRWDIEIGIIDAKTGDTLYIARSKGERNILKEPDKVKPDIEKSFDEFMKDNKQN